MLNHTAAPIELQYIRAIYTSPPKTFNFIKKETLAQGVRIRG